MKKLTHDTCGKEVNRRTLICSKCKVRPPGKELTLQKGDK